MKKNWGNITLLFSLMTTCFFATTLEARVLDPFVFSPPKSREWMVLTDGSERSGPTTAELTDLSEGVRFEGILGSIPASSFAGEVGFAIARVPITLGPETEEFIFHLNSKFPVVLKIIVTTELVQLPTRAGKLSYETTMPLLPGVRAIQFKLRDFKASVRGRPTDEAPRLEASSIKSIGLLIARSCQTTSMPGTPMPFSIFVLRP